MTSEERLQKIRAYWWRYQYPDLGSASDWLKQIFLAARPIRRTTQIWIMSRHQYEFRFCSHSSATWLFSQAKLRLKLCVNAQVWELKHFVEGNLSKHITLQSNIGNLTATKMTVMTICVLYSVCASFAITAKNSSSRAVWFVRSSLSRHILIRPWESPVATIWRLKDETQRNGTVRLRKATNLQNVMRLKKGL